MGLINDQRWKDVRAQFHKYFTYDAVEQSYGFLSSFTEDYFRKLETKETKEPNHIEPHPVASFSRFPFLATAEYLYGHLTETQKNELWTLGQRSLGIMVHVLEGGVYRFGISRFVKPKEYKTLKKFETDWKAFNEAIVEAKKTLVDPPPAVKAWRAVDEGVITKKEVSKFSHTVLIPF